MVVNQIDFTIKQLYQLDHWSKIMINQSTISSHYQLRNTLHAAQRHWRKGTALGVCAGVVSAVIH